MNNDQLFEDLKQFIDSRISQSERFMRGEFQQNIDRLDQKMDDGFAGVADSIEQINQRLDDRNEEVDRRLTKIEQRLPR